MIGKANLSRSLEWRKAGRYIEIRTVIIINPEKTHSNLGRVVRREKSPDVRVSKQNAKNPLQISQVKSGRGRGRKKRVCGAKHAEDPETQHENVEGGHVNS